MNSGRSTPSSLVRDKHVTASSKENITTIKINVNPPTPTKSPTKSPKAQPGSSAPETEITHVGPQDPPAKAGPQSGSSAPKTEMSITHVGPQDTPAKDNPQPGSSAPLRRTPFRINREAGWGSSNKIDQTGRGSFKRMDQAGQGNVSVIASISQQIGKKVDTNSILNDNRKYSGKAIERKEAENGKAIIGEKETETENKPIEANNRKISGKAFEKKHMGTENEDKDRKISGKADTRGNPAEVTEDNIIEVGAISRKTSETTRVKKEGMVGTKKNSSSDLKIGKAKPPEKKAKISVDSEKRVKPVKSAKMVQKVAHENSKKILKKTQENVSVENISDESDNGFEKGFRPRDAEIGDDKKTSNVGNGQYTDELLEYLADNSSQSDVEESSDGVKVTDDGEVFFNAVRPGEGADLIRELRPHGGLYKDLDALIKVGVKTSFIYM